MAGGTLHDAMPSDISLPNSVAPKAAAIHAPTTGATS
jgi:hypothetical protein